MSLPKKKELCTNLKMEDIKDDDYKHVKNILEHKVYDSIVIYTCKLTYY